MNVFYLTKRKIFKFYKSHYKYRLHYTVLLIKVNEKDVIFWVLCCGCWFSNSNHNNPFWSSFLVLYIGIVLEGLLPCWALLELFNHVIFFLLVILNNLLVNQLMIYLFIFCLPIFNSKYYHIYIYIFDF
jgi:hypothetical protein